MQTQRQPGQVIQFPQIGPNGQYLPTFPVLANTVDTYATRIPWYAWFALGAFVTFKLLKTKGRE